MFASQYNAINEKPKIKRMDVIKQHIYTSTPKAIKTVVYEHNPKFKGSMANYDNDVDYLCVECAELVWNMLLHILHIDKHPENNDIVIKKDIIISEKFWKEKLDKKKKQFPLQYHYKIEKDHWEKFRDIQLHENFKVAIAETIKSILVKECFNEIQNLDGDSLRCLNFCIYSNCAAVFVKRIEQLY